MPKVGDVVQITATGRDASMIGKKLLVTDVEYGTFNVLRKMTCEEVVTADVVRP
ncbi:MAG: DUF6093 family protein [Actinomycetota bacterium]